MLAQAIETTDAEGKLIPLAERDRVTREALREIRSGTRATAVPMPAEKVLAFLNRRAAKFISAVEPANAALAALQVRASAAWLAPLMLVLSIGLGALTDRVSNPHRVDLLSLPLLVILAWNLCVYVFLGMAALGGLRTRGRAPDGFRRVTAGSGGAGFVIGKFAARLHGWNRVSGQLARRASALFLLRWNLMSAPLTAQRGRILLHLAAAGWAIGVALSLFTRGLVVEYRVGWESTFLNATQVHAVLSVLLAPAIALLPVEPFTVQEIARLQFSQPGAGEGGAMGARWVYLYASLLMLVVVLPRLALALYAHRRARRLSQSLPLDSSDPYLQRLMVMVNPATVRLGIASSNGGLLHSALLALGVRARVQEAAASLPHAGLLLRSSSGEELHYAVLEARPGAAAGSAPAQPASVWRDRIASLWGRPAGVEKAHADVPVDLVLLAVRGAGDMGPALAGTGVDAAVPVLVLLHRGEVDKQADRQADASVQRCTAELKSLQRRGAVLDAAAYGACWSQDPVLLDAMAQLLQGSAAEGFARLADVWKERNRLRFERSMALLARQLAHAALQSQDMQVTAGPLRRLVNSADRQAESARRQQAMDALLENLRISAERAQQELLRLHGLDALEGEQLMLELQRQFKVSESVSLSQAGMAGAATGAAMGASVDLLAGGLTLGAAAALGALMGGGAAFGAAAWKNRGTAAGATSIQLSDDMLLALVEAALLHYLATIHAAHAQAHIPGNLSAPAGAASEVAPAAQVLAWRAAVEGAVKPRREFFVGRFAELRQGGDSKAEETGGQLGVDLQRVTEELLRKLYPPPSAPVAVVAAPAP